MTEYFPEQNSLGANVKVELDVSNYATKADLQNAIGVDISKFPKKTLGRLQYLTIYCSVIGR